jgi:hypothetical protein
VCFSVIQDGIDAVRRITFWLKDHPGLSWFILIVGILAVIWSFMPTRARRRWLRLFTPKALIYFGFAVVFVFLAAALFQYSSPKLPVNRSYGGTVSLLVSDPNVSLSLNADFTRDEVTLLGGGYSSRVSVDAVPGRFVVYSITVFARVGTKPNIVLILSGDSRLSDVFFTRSGGSLVESRAPRFFTYQLGDGSRSVPQVGAQLFHGSVPIEHQGGETLTLIGTRRGGIVKQAGASADVSLPAFSKLAAAGQNVLFPGLVPGVWYSSKDFQASVTAGEVSGFVRVEYVSPPPPVPTELTWTTKVLEPQQHEGMAPRYAVTNRYDERRLSRILFFAGVVAGLAGGFVVEAMIDVVDTAVHRRSRRITRPMRSSRSSSARVHQTNSGRRRLMPRNIRKQIAARRARG